MEAYPDRDAARAGTGARSDAALPGARKPNAEVAGRKVVVAAHHALAVRCGRRRQVRDGASSLEVGEAERCEVPIVVIDRLAERCRDTTHAVEEDGVVPLQELAHCARLDRVLGRVRDGRRSAPSRSRPALSRSARWSRGGRGGGPPGICWARLQSRGLPGRHCPTRQRRASRRPRGKGEDRRMESRARRRSMRHLLGACISDRRSLL